jgi:nitric oxide reductase NorQ protein
MPPKLQQIPCTHCPYEAASDQDLAGHMGHAHPGQDGGTAPEKPPPEAKPESTLADWDKVIQRAGKPPEVEPAAPPLPTTLAVPEPDDTFWVDDKVVRLLHTMGRISQKGNVLNILLTGPKGTGKTSLPKEFAATQGRPFFTVHCQLIAERDDWWGSKELSLDRGTYFERAAFLDAVETEGCDILLDEANRTHPENLNALFGFLDHRRSAWVPQLKQEVKVAAGVVFFITLNEGYEYVGTNPIDEALRDRMTYSVRMSYVPKRVEMSILVKRTSLDEEIAGKLTEFARSVRRNPKIGVPISTRQLLGAASLIVEGMPIQDAVKFAVVNGMGEDVDRSALLQALQIIGKVDDAYVSQEPQGDDDE